MKTVQNMLLGICVVAILTTLNVRVARAYDPVKDKAPYYLTNDELDKSFGVDPETKTPDDYVRLIYFHRVPGCATCQAMSKYVYETILKNYSDEIKNRRIILRYVNFEDPKNAKLVRTFRITSPSLVLIQGKNGKDVKAKYASKIWSLAGNKKVFMEYVGKEIDGYLKQDAPTNVK